MKKLYPNAVLLSSLFLLGSKILAQNIAVNTSGTAAGATNMFEVTQTSAAANMVAIYAINSGATAGTGYGLYSTKTGAGTTNIAGYFTASGGASNYSGIFDQGNVGIGTITPTYKLHVSSGSAWSANFTSTATANGGIYINAASTFNANIALQENAVDKWYLGNRASDDRFSWINAGGSTEVMSILQGGNVGIGTAGPTSKLHVYGNTGVDIRLEDAAVANAAWRILPQTGNTTKLFRIYDATAALDRMVIDASGNVGIGTTTPNVLLTVKGSNTAGNYPMINFLHPLNLSNGFQIGTTTWSDGVNVEVWNWENGYMRFATNALERLRIQANGNVGIGTTSPTVKLQVAGDVLRTNTRVSSSQRYPVAHSGDVDAFSIDPTWSNAELQAYFNNSNVQWFNDATAPAGYCIQVTGAVSVGGAYNSGFPYIPIDQNASYYMECWIKSSAASGHYMGSIEYDENLANGSGNPGSYGYWTMLNTATNTTWIKVSGTITGFGAATGQFQAGKKYWTPQALFNYGFGGVTCYISGWRVVKLSSANVAPGSGNYIQNQVAANQVAGFRINGNGLFNGGSVGIGTITPLSPLHTTGNLTTVGGAATAGSVGNVQITTGGGSPISNRLTFGTDGSGWKFAIGKNQAGTVSDYLTVQDNGNVGIGTTAPGSLLHLYSPNVLDVPRGDLVLSRYWASGADTRASSVFHYYNSTSGNDNLAFGVSGNGGTNGQPNALAQIKMLIQGSGKVGIGTTSPAALLHVGALTTGRQLIAGSWAWADISSNTSGRGLFGGNVYTDHNPEAFKYSETHASIGAMGFAVNYPSWNKASVITSGTTSSTTGTAFTPVTIATFDYTGNVGIGTTAPSAVLHVEKNQNDKTRIRLQNSTANTSAVAEFLASRTTGNTGIVSIGIGDANYANTAYPVDFRGAYIYTDVTQGLALRADAGPIRFVTINGIVPTENMTILAGGNVGIKNTAPAYPLSVNGDASICGTLRYTSASAACSDIRYKKDILPLPNALNNVMKLQGVNYHWKKDEFPERKFSDEKQIGFIAQEIEKIYPEVVITDKDGYKSVDYSRLTPILVEAIKEQQKLISNLETAVGGLKSENKTLRSEYDARLKKLEELLGAKAEK